MPVFGLGEEAGEPGLSPRKTRGEHAKLHTRKARNRTHNLPADVEREHVLRQQLGLHGRVKHRHHFGHRDGGVGHAQDPVEARHHKGHAGLFHGLAELLAGDGQAGDLRAGKDVSGDKEKGWK